MNNNEIIDDLMARIENLHPCLYFKVSKEEIDKYIEDNIRNKDLSDLELFYHIQRILKLIGDPHITCQYKKKKFPLRLKMIDNKVLVTCASNSYQQYIGSVITKINGVDINIVINEMGKIVSYTAIGHFYGVLGFDLLRGTSLLCLPIFKGHDDNITYTFNKDGVETDCVFNWSTKYDYTGLDSKNYSYKYDENNNVLIIKYKSCYEEENYPMKQFIDDINEVVQRHSIKDVIVDLKGNGGGRSGVTDVLIEYLNNMKFNLVTLVDNAVYSSGRWAVVDLRRIGSKFVGTEMGTSFNCFGHVEKFMIDNKFEICCSTKYFYCTDRVNWVTKENFSDFYNNPDNNKYFDTSNLVPDVYVQNSFDDCVNNYDKVLDCGVKFLLNKNHSKTNNL